MQWLLQTLESTLRPERSDSLSDAVPLTLPKDFMVHVITNNLKDAKKMFLKRES